MATLKLLHGHHAHRFIPRSFSPPQSILPNFQSASFVKPFNGGALPSAMPMPLKTLRQRRSLSIPVSTSRPRAAIVSASLPPLDLTENNINQVLADARAELGQIFDTSVGMTGKAELADLDGPYVKIRLSGRFWHKRSTVLSRLGNYLRQRIPEILEVDIEDEKQLDDSPENF